MLLKWLKAILPETRNKNLFSALKDNDTTICFAYPDSHDHGPL